MGDGMKNSKVKIDIEKGIPYSIKKRLLDCFEECRLTFWNREDKFVGGVFGELCIAEEVSEMLWDGSFHGNLFDTLLREVDFDSCKLSVYRNELYEVTVYCGELIGISIREPFSRWYNELDDPCFRYVLDNLVEDGFGGYVYKDYFLEFALLSYVRLYKTSVFNNDGLIIKKEGVFDLTVTKHASRRISRRLIEVGDVLDTLSFCKNSVVDEKGNLKYEGRLVTVVLSSDKQTLITAFYRYEFSSGVLWRTFKRENNDRLRKVLLRYNDRLDDLDKQLVERYVLFGDCEGASSLLLH